MKNVYLIALASFILFSACESKLTKFNINKKAPQHFIFADLDGVVDTSVVLNSIVRSSLDISENAKITKVELKSVYVLIQGLKNHFPQDLKIEGSVKLNANGSNTQLFTFSETINDSPIKLNVAVQGFLALGGVKDINKFLHDNLVLQTATAAKLYLKATPVSGSGKPINLDFTINFDFNIEYEDCFATGNLGEDECAK